MKIKKITTLALTAFLAIGVCGCGSDKKTDSEGYVSTKSVSERIEDYKEIEKEYNKNVKGGIIDNNTPEAQAEYKKKKEELLRFSPESELKKTIEEQCKSIKNNDVDSYIDTVNIECAKYNLLYFESHSPQMSDILPKTEDELKEQISNKGKLDDYFKGYISEEAFNKINKDNLSDDEWPSDISVDSLELKHSGAIANSNYRLNTDGMFDTAAPPTEYIIETTYYFTLKNSEIYGKVSAYQSVDHGNLVIVERIGRKSSMNLQNSNSIAKYAYTICSNYIADKMAEGNSMDDILNSGAFSKSMSSQGLDIEQTGDVGEGDRLLIDGIKIYYIYSA